MSIAMLAFAIVDVASYRRPRRTFRSAYLEHGSRMYFAWWMLLMGPIIRSHHWDGLTSLLSTVLVLGAYAGLRVHWQRQLAAASSRSTRTRGSP